MASLIREVRGFNPRPRAGSDGLRSAQPAGRARFNPRPRAGSDGKRGALSLIEWAFQSTPPRGERPEPVALTPESEPVSIHAPARGATINMLRTWRLWHVSIHAPARGATAAVGDIRHLGDVSIHAPARGATGKRRGEPWILTVSIHAPARGATPEFEKLSLDEQFQSTPPRGERHEVHAVK